MPTSNYAEKPTILVIEDTPDDVALIAGLLRTQYRIIIAKQGKSGLALATVDSAPDLILLDIMMPDMDGYEVCRALKASSATRDIPVIFLTGKTSIDDEQFGFSLGAVDYITKPVSPPLLLARVATHIALKRASDFLRDKNTWLETEIARRDSQMSAIQDVTILTMASMAETRDTETGNHIRRTQNYVKALALRLQPHPRFSLFLSDENIDTLYK